LKVLFVFLILDNARRRILHFNFTETPTAVWTGQQVVEAFPCDSAPRFLIRDRDGIYGLVFERRVDSLGIEQVRTVHFRGRSSHPRLGAVRSEPVQGRLHHRYFRRAA